MARDFLGRGWHFPVEVNRSGGIALSEDEESIRESIRTILGTAPGERVMRQHFGCEIHELIFAPSSLNTATLAAHFCVEALQKWEPRIDAVEADGDVSRDEQNRIDIHIKYKVRASNSARNLVYPFYLRKSEES